MKVYSPAQVEQNPTIKMLVVGEPGSGKTRGAASWPDVLYLNADDGLLSVRDRDVKAVDIATIKDLEEVKRALDQAPKIREQLFGGPVRTVVLDTLDEIARIVIRERLEAEKKTAMAIQDWGYLGDTMRNMVRGFRNLDDMNVIFNVHIKTDTDSETGRVGYKPAIQGAFGDEVAGYVDMALLLKARTVNNPKTNVKERRHFLQTFPDAQHPWVKDRSGSLPMEFPVNFDDDFDRLCVAVFGASPDDIAARVADVAALSAELKADKAKQVADAAKAAAAAPKAAPPKSAPKSSASKPAAAAKAAPTKAAPAAAPAAKPAAKPVAASAPAAETPPASATPPAEPEPTPDPVEEEPSGASIAIEEDQTADEDGVITTPDPEPEIEVVETTPETVIEPDPEPEPVTEPEVTEPVADVDDDDDDEVDGGGDSVEDDQAVAEAVTPTAGPAEDAPASEVPDCAVCGEQVENSDYADLSMIRFKKPLCRKHFAEAKSGK